MIFHKSALNGAFCIEPQPHRDERGFFSRVFCREAFAKQGLHIEFVQCNISFNIRKGTVRGLHYQDAPMEEVKIVRCTMGAIYDVFVDLRPDYPSYLQWEAVELTAKNRLMLYIPSGFAHGFQTLSDDTEVFYQMGQSFSPAHARGIRHDDPTLGIRWPLAVTVLSPKDAGYPDYRP